MSFDVENLSGGGWTALPSLATARYGPGCATGSYEGQAGIYVTGGWDGAAYLASVEFYLAGDQRWVGLGQMRTARYWHSLSLVSGVPYAAGGYPYTTEVERLPAGGSGAWEAAGSLAEWRYLHTAVTLPAGLVACEEDSGR